jgi:RHS repeat-associated protein
MRTGSGTGTTGVNWLFGDHLSSQSVTADASGNKSAEIRFKAWGEDRYTSGTTPTSFRYTGQRNEAVLGIMFYGARWYDPALSRFLSPDTLVPAASQGVQAWDRMAYANNNPVSNTDPTGHCIGCNIIPQIYSFLGLAPDYRGISTAETYMDPQKDSITVAAGIAVQSQWYGLADTRIFAPNGPNSGLGIAQVSDSQMAEYGLAGLDQTDPKIAIQAMQARIGLVQGACSGCSARDQLIAAGLAQNGSGFTAASMSYVVRKYMGYGSINWSGYFAEPRTPSDPIARIRRR